MYKERKFTVSDRLKEAMQIKGIRQVDLCRICNIPKGAMSLYISGAYEPKQDRIYLISKALNVSEAWLIGYDVPMERQIKKTSPSEAELSEGEQMLLDLFRQIPANKQEVVLEMIRLALKTQE